MLDAGKREEKRKFSSIKKKFFIENLVNFKNKITKTFTHKFVQPNSKESKIPNYNPKNATEERK